MPLPPHYLLLGRMKDADLHQHDTEFDEKSGWFTNFAVFIQRNNTHIVIPAQAGIHRSDLRQIRDDER